MKLLSQVKNWIATKSVFLLVMFILFSNQLQAATILKADSSELLSQSELIFEGEVVDLNSKWGSNERIYSYVRFQVLDVVKGEFEAGFITLRFTGGTVGEVTMDAGVVIPGRGEKGIYFVEKVEHHLLNPLFGWKQGHFIVNKQGQVMAGDGNPVYGVELSREAKVREVSRGVARGVKTEPKNAARSAQFLKSEGVSAQQSPMQAGEFKIRIRELLKTLQLSDSIQ